MNYYVRMLDNHSVLYLSSLNLDITEGVLDEIQDYIRKNKEKLYMGKDERARILAYYGNDGSLPEDKEERINFLSSYGYSKEEALKILQGTDVQYQIIDGFGIIQYETHVFFELNNWTPDEDYPDEEPFTTWIGDDLCIYFNDEKWVAQNHLCVVRDIIDMSVNFCITTTREWVMGNCPKLLTEHKEFLRFYEEEEDTVYGRFGNEFLKYEKENIGIIYDDIH